MVTVTSCRPASLTVKLVVGQSNAVGGSLAGDEHLTTDQGELAVVDPDQVGSSKSESITTPDVLRVKLSDVNILDDNVLSTIGNP